MKQLRHLCALSSLAVTMLWLTMAAAAAQVPPPDPGGVIAPHQPPPASAVSDGSPTWALLTVALLAIVLTAAATLSAVKLRRSPHLRATHS